MYRRPDPETVRVYDAEHIAVHTLARPVHQARHVRVLVDQIKATVPEIADLDIKVTHGRGRVSRGGFALRRVASRPNWDELQNARARGDVVAGEMWHVRWNDYLRSPRRRHYFVCIAASMRNVWTITHELAHILQLARIPSDADCGRVQHGIDFRRAHLDILDAWDPSMARIMRMVYTGAGLEF